MKKWSLNTKILLILSIFIIGSIAIAMTGITGMSRLDDSLDKIVNENAKKLNYAQEMKELFAILCMNEKNFILEETKEGMDVYKKKLDEDIEKLTQKMKDYEDIASPAGKKNIADFRGFFESWIKIDNEVQKIASEGKSHEAAKLSNTTGRNFRKKAEEVVNSIVDRNKNVMKEKSLEAANLYESLKKTSIAISLIAMILGMTFAYFVLKSVNHAIDQVILNLTDSSGQVTSAAHQIAAASEELSGAVTEQASSLQEASSSIEELNSMVQKNAENAKKTSGLAGSSTDSAKKGKQAVQNMVEAIDDINESNSSMMNSINESNQKIAEIVSVISEIGNKTKVINDIVFQTRLLSFNASVEAARAGENGKGFAVVAEEIGNLAEMSGNSAQEITALLDSSIHKVEKIVSETKQKVNDMVDDGKIKVETGTRIAKDCDSILNEIVFNVSSVTDMANEISGACQEQALGVQEISRAMAQLDQVTQNNSASSEEAASAATELSSQAESLQAVIGILVDTIKGEAARMNRVV